MADNLDRCTGAGHRGLARVPAGGRRLAALLAVAIGTASCALGGRRTPGGDTVVEPRIVLSIRNDYPEPATVFLRLDQVRIRLVTVPSRGSARCGISGQLVGLTAAIQVRVPSVPKYVSTDEFVIDGMAPLELLIGNQPRLFARLHKA